MNTLKLTCIRENHDSNVNKLPKRIFQKPDNYKYKF